MKRQRGTPLTDDQLAEAALFRMHGLSWRKIAIWYELPHGTVRDHVSRFMQQD